MVENSESISKDEIVKAAILQAAERVFQKWGLNKTTMEDIAKEAGKGKSTLYYYYKSKEEIFETVIMTLFNEILIKAKKMIQGVNSPKDQLKKYVITTLTEMKNKALVYSIVRNEMQGNKALIDKIKNKFEITEKNFIKDILMQGLQSNEFNFTKDELDSAAKTIVCIIHALYMYLFLDDNDNIDINQKINITAKLITSGL